jgi:magnesium transporter
VVGHEGGNGQLGASGGDFPTPVALEVATPETARFTATLARPVVSLIRNGGKRRATPAPPAPAPGQVIGCQIYREGVPITEATTYVDAPLDAPDIARARRGAFVWLGLLEPTERDFSAVARAYGIDPAAIHEAVVPHQRPRLTQYDDTLLVNLATARYVDHSELTGQSEVVDTGQVTVFVGKDFVVTVRRGTHGGLKKLRKDLEGRPAVLRHGPAAVLHAICEQVVEDYRMVTDKLEADLDTIEAAVFDGRSRMPNTEKVYQLKRELLELKHAVMPLATPLRTLANTKIPQVDMRVREYFRDTADQLEHVTEKVNNYDELVTSILQATLTQVTVAQNEDMRRISAWVAIAAVPTAVAGIYGMNFQHMPELELTWGYPAVLTVIAISCLLLYLTFKRNHWL